MRDEGHATDDDDDNKDDDGEGVVRAEGGRWHGRTTGLTTMTTTMGAMLATPAGDGIQQDTLEAIDWARAACTA